MYINEKMFLKLETITTKWIGVFLKAFDIEHRLETLVIYCFHA